MKIAYLTSCQIFPAGPTAGTERFVEDEISFLKEAEDLKVFCSEDANIDNNKWDSLEEVLKEIGRQNFDLILSRGISFIGLNLPCMTISTCDGGVAKDRELEIQENLFYRFLSQDHYNMWAQSDEEKEKSFWVYGGFGGQNYEFCKKGDYILWVGSLFWGYQTKGLDIFVELAKQFKNERFIAYGVGPKEITDHLNNLNIPNFQFKGELKDEDKSSVYGNAKLFCQFTRLRESFGRTTIEAMSKGCPVAHLGQNSGTVSEILGDKNVVQNFGDFQKVLDNCNDREWFYNKSLGFTIENWWGEMKKNIGSIPKQRLLGV